MRVDMKNSKGYLDLTCHKALTNVTREEKAASKPAFKKISSNGPKFQISKSETVNGRYDKISKQQKMFWKIMMNNLSGN